MLESSDCVSGKKEWRKLLGMKVSYFSAITHVSGSNTSNIFHKFKKKKTHCVLNAVSHGVVFALIATHGQAL